MTLQGLHLVLQGRDFGLQMPLLLPQKAVSLLQKASLLFQVGFALLDFWAELSAPPFNPGIRNKHALIANALSFWGVSNLQTN